MERAGYVAPRAAGGRYLPGLKVMRQVLLVQVPSGKIMIWGRGDGASALKLRMGPGTPGPQSGTRARAQLARSQSGQH